MRLLVCGGRDMDDRDLVFRTLDEFDKDWGIDLVIHGGCRGADQLAGEWAKERGITVKVYYADWSRGKKAGIERNQRMLDKGNPNMILAFPGGRGTENMVMMSKKWGKPVIRVDKEEKEKEKEKEED